MCVLIILKWNAPFCLAKPSFTYWEQMRPSFGFGPRERNKPCLRRRFDAEPLKTKASWRCGARCGARHRPNLWAARRDAMSASLLIQDQFEQQFQYTFDHTVQTSALSCETFSFKWIWQTKGIIPIMVNIHKVASVTESRTLSAAHRYLPEAFTGLFRSYILY